MPAPRAFSAAMLAVLLSVSWQPFLTGTGAAAEWRGGRDGLRGQERCRQTRTQPDRSEMTLILHRSGRLAMVLQHHRPLRLPLYQRVILQFIFDEGRAPVSASIVPTAPGRAVIPLAGALVPGLRTGHTLGVKHRGGIWRFDISGVAAALDALQRCRETMP